MARRSVDSDWRSSHDHGRACTDGRRRFLPINTSAGGRKSDVLRVHELRIEVKMSISSTQESSNTFSVGVSVTASADFLFARARFTAHVNFTSANKYSYSVTGSSSMSTVLEAGAAAEEHDAAILPGERDRSGRRSQSARADVASGTDEVSRALDCPADFANCPASLIQTQGDGINACERKPLNRGSHGNECWR